MRRWKLIVIFYKVYPQIHLYHSLPDKHSTLTSLESAIIHPLLEYFHASIETLYGQLDIPWFPVDAIPPELPPSPPSDPINQSPDIEPYAPVSYHIALMLFDEIQLLFPFTFSAL